jgi:hypothetical protein
MERILSILGAKQPFNQDGELTTDGLDAYEKLVEILIELNMIGAISESIDNLEKYFDEIISND